MKYIVLEIQTEESGKVSTLVTAHDTEPKALQKYHTVLAAAAVSNVKYHSAVLLDDQGNWLRSEMPIKGGEEA